MVEQGIWIIRTNQELRELCKDLDVAADIKKRLEWIGCLVRMDQRRTVKKIYESKPEGSRRQESPRFRWPEEVERDLWEMRVKKR